VTEFNYRMSDSDKAHVFLGLSTHGKGESTIIASRGDKGESTSIARRGGKGESSVVARRGGKGESLATRAGAA
jgi:hypothetical protein